MTKRDEEKVFRECLERYANGRELCNCGEAYGPRCQHGCSTNRIYAKYNLVANMAAELTELKAKLSHDKA